MQATTTTAIKSERAERLRRDRTYGTSWAAHRGDVVTQGHRDYCEDFGCATFTDNNGTVSGFCPRCGEKVVPATVSARNMLADDINSAMNNVSGIRNKAYAVSVVIAEWDEVRGPEGGNSERDALGSLEDAIDCAIDNMEMDCDYDYACAEATVYAATDWVRRNR